MHRGRLVFDGDTAAAVGTYLSSAHFDLNSQQRTSAQRVQITSVRFISADGANLSTCEAERPLRATLRYRADKHIDDVYFGLYFYGADGQLYIQFTTRDSLLTLYPGEGEIEFTCDHLVLRPGIYYVDAAIELDGCPEPEEWLRHCTTLHVQSLTVLRGLSRQPHRWRHVAEAENLVGADGVPAEHSS
jgi:hypothetical protein